MQGRRRWSPKTDNTNEGYSTVLKMQYSHVGQKAGYKGYLGVCFDVLSLECSYLSVWVQVYNC